MSENNPWVTITHPETGNEATVREAAVPHFEALGWQRAAEPKKPAAKDTGAKAAVTTSGRKSTSEKE